MQKTANKIKLYSFANCINTILGSFLNCQSEILLLNVNEFKRIEEKFFPGTLYFLLDNNCTAGNNNENNNGSNRELLLHQLHDIR